MEALVSDYLEGELDALTERRVQAHLAECSACAALVQGIARTCAAVRSLRDCPEPADFRLRLATRLSEAAATRRPAENASRWALIVAAAVAVAVPLRTGWSLPVPHRWVRRLPAAVAIQARPLAPVPAGPTAPHRGLPAWRS